MLDAPKSWRVARGLVKHAYHTAAEVTGCVVTFDEPPTTARLVGAVTDPDGYLLTQTPLVFVVPTKSGAWRWPIQSFAVTDGRLAARLGAFMEGT